MTPEEEFAQKRAQAEQLIRQYAPQRLQEQLISLLRPAIALTATRTDDAQIPVGASKFGGAPDVPDDFEWPMWNGKPLGFLAQIDLEEVAPFDVEEVLPKSGLLSFFYEVDEPNWTDVSTPGSWRVFLFDRSVRRARVDRETEFFPASICFSAGWSSASTFNGSSDDDSEWMWRSNVSPCVSTGKVPYQGHQMLGYGSPIVVDPAWYAERRSHPTKDEFDVQPSPEDVHQWILLFQLDSDYEINTMWGDVGTLYFMIRREDLQARRFDQTWMELEYT